MLGLTDAAEKCPLPISACNEVEYELTECDLAVTSVISVVSETLTSSAKYLSAALLLTLGSGKGGKGCGCGVALDLLVIMTGCLLLLLTMLGVHEGARTGVMCGAGGSLLLVGVAQCTTLTWVAVGFVAVIVLGVHMAVLLANSTLSRRRWVAINLGGCGLGAAAYMMTGVSVFGFPPNSPAVAIDCGRLGCC